MYISLVYPYFRVRYSTKLVVFIYNDLLYEDEWPRLDDDNVAL